MRFGLQTWGICWLLAAGIAAAESPLHRSDVVFMYQADRQTYEQYGATVLAWGGTPTERSKATAKAAGVKFFGSVGMVTEFGRYYERFPKTYDQALCRDIDGQPVKVPWLTDHQHKGVPYWWCCTHQPQFRQYLRERVIETVQAVPTVCISTITWERLVVCGWGFASAIAAWPISSSTCRRFQPKSCGSWASTIPRTLTTEMWCANGRQHPRAARNDP